MQDNPPSEKDEALSKLLRNWKADAPLPPRFQEAVWNRIAQAETREGAAYWTIFSGWLEAIFARPRFALSYVAILLFAGLGAGFWQAHGRVVHDETALRARYVQVVDPYQMPRN
jgi:hypothetical protein